MILMTFYAPYGAHNIYNKYNINKLYICIYFEPPDDPSCLQRLFGAIQTKPIFQQEKQERLPEEEVTRIRRMMSSLAARTQLPPSPELNAALANHHQPSTDHAASAPFLESSSSTQQPPPRLRAVAQYGSYRPQILATTTSSSSSYPPHFGGTSLGAVAGPAGVALFRVAQPSTPLALWHTATTTTTALQFSPDGRYLAAARGSSLAIGDVAATATSAAGSLQTRAEAPAAITSLAWGGQLPQQQGNIVGATTAHTVCLWDLRTSVGNHHYHSSSSGSAVKPTLRFGTTNTSVPYVQMAMATSTDQQHMIAVMDASGVLRLWDCRYLPMPGGSATTTMPATISSNSHMTTTGSVRDDALYTLPVLRSVGIGIQAATHVSSSSWVVWGYDAMHQAAVAKIVSPRASSTTTTTLEATDDQTDDMTTSDMGLLPFTLTTLPTQTDLACARVCGDIVVTFGSIHRDTTQSEPLSMTPSTESPPQLQWQADVFRLSSSSSFSSSHEPQLITSFHVTSKYGNVCATELALSTFGSTFLEEGTPHLPQRTSGLMLVSLTQEGNITTHVSTIYNNNPARQLF